MEELRERPFGESLIAGWFAIGGVVMIRVVLSMIRAMQVLASSFANTVLSILSAVVLVVAAALFWMAVMLWRDAARVRVAACVLLVVSGILVAWKGATPFYYGVAAVNLVALLYLARPGALTSRAPGSGSRSGPR